MLFKSQIAIEKFNKDVSKETKKGGLWIGVWKRTILITAEIAERISRFYLDLHL